MVALDPTLGSEIRKTRPCVVVSPDELNEFLNTIIVAPITRTLKKYPTRINFDLKKEKNQIALDQIRTVDKKRLIKKMAILKEIDAQKVCKILQELFAFS